LRIDDESWSVDASMRTILRENKSVELFDEISKDDSDEKKN